jgi:hypothetical protein
MTLALLLLGAGTALATDQAFSVTMVMRQAITISAGATLDFGTVENVPATLYTVNPNAGPHTAGATAAAALFTVQGENLAVGDVTFVNNPVVIDDGTTNINVTLSLAGGVPDTINFTGAPQNLYVGGSFTVPGGATNGSYSNTAATAILRITYQ